MSDVPFCERNTRLWIWALLASGAVVLGFAIWLAFDKHAPEPGRAQVAVAAGAPAGPAPAMVPGAHRPAPGAVAVPARPVAWQRTASPAQQLQASFNRAADVIRPAVVNINAVRPGVMGGAPAGANQPRFVDPFDGVPEKMFGNVAYESVGSGVIVDPAGYVVTNHHLVANATSIVVTRYQNANRHLSAATVALDPRSDLALLKLGGQGPYPVARLADASRVEVGDWVLAVGNPFGLGHTVTSGIISGRSRAMVIGGVEYRGLLQTDAPINQGSSGGPLVNLNGEVVGINTAIYAPTGVFNGTGFAIPANRVGAFVARVLQRNAVPAAAMRPPPSALAPGCGWLGLQVIDVSPPLAAKLGLPRPMGGLVSSVGPGSAAEEAEIARGDVITAVAGAPVASGSSLQAMVAGLGPGAVVPVTVWRNGSEKTLKLKIKGRSARQWR
jgi:serine protease Do